ncbi:unnamed protein product, partial [marine sediment metagenome]
ESIGIGLMGLGVIGGGVVKALSSKTQALAEQIGCPLVLRKVKVLEADLKRPVAKEMAPGLLTTDDDEFFSNPEINIIVELIGGENPALTYLKRAITSGRQVVTANKELIAKHGVELLAWPRSIM